MFLFSPVKRGRLSKLRKKWSPCQWPNLPQPKSLFLRGSGGVTAAAQATAPQRKSQAPKLLHQQQVQQKLCFILVTSTILNDIASVVTWQLIMTDGYCRDILSLTGLTLVCWCILLLQSLTVKVSWVSPRRRKLQVPQDTNDTERTEEKHELQEGMVARAGNQVRSQIFSDKMLDFSPSLKSVTNEGKLPRWWSHILKLCIKNKTISDCQLLRVTAKRRKKTKRGPLRPHVVVTPAGARGWPEMLLQTGNGQVTTTEIMNLKFWILIKSHITISSIIVYSRKSHTNVVQNGYTCHDKVE